MDNSLSFTYSAKYCFTKKKNWKSDIQRSFKLHAAWIIVFPVASFLLHHSRKPGRDQWSHLSTPHVRRSWAAVALWLTWDTSSVLPFLFIFLILSSQNNTFLLPLVVLLFTAEGQSFFCRLLENVFHVLLIFSRALEVELCVHLLPGLLTLHPNTPRLLPRGGW